MTKINTFFSLVSLLCFLFVSVHSTQAFTENTSSPPNNNTPIPINDSAATQLKRGPFLSNSYISADVFYDRYNSSYYINANGTSRLNALTTNSLYSTGNGNVNDLYVRARGRWVSQIGRSYIQPYGSFREPGYLYCAPGYTLMGVGGHLPESDRLMSWRIAGNRGVSVCTGASCDGEVVNSAWISCISN